MSKKTNWVDEVELPSEVKKIGNSEVKTDQDILKNVVTIRASDNQKAKVKEILKDINKDIKKPLRRVKEADIWRLAVESLYDSYFSKDA